MIKITNTSRAMFHFPDGTPLEPGVPTTVKDWEVHSKNAAVRAWIDHGVLAVTDETAPAPDED